jgi:hypothetical protein
MMLLGLVASSAEASPIRQHLITAQGAKDLSSWSNFLTGGAALWSHRSAPHISGAVKFAMASALQTSDPRSSPWVQYLLWRQGLNVKRFNFYHPQLGPALQNLPPPTAPPINHGQGPGSTPNSPGNVIPPATPEPSTILIAIMLIGSGTWWRSGTRRSPLLAKS